MFQKVAINILYIIGLILLGYILGVYVSRPSVSVDEPIDIEKIDSLLVSKEKATIDSLTLVIEEYKKINSDLKDSIKEVVIIRTEKVDEVRKLPLDSGVLFLNHKLREFENRFN